MTSETLLHINEALDSGQQEELLRSFGNRADGMHARMHATKPHMLFVAYDPEEMCPHDLVEIAGDAGVHAQVIDF